WALVPGAGPGLLKVFSGGPRLGAGPREIVTCRAPLRRRGPRHSRPAAGCT
ncbi:MAG: hypothetical protein AVDCRST_MAG12-804, partial [uncultured Rubrobacteraceae bacterium]